MSPLRFCFVLHIHQPVGNFEHVFRQHADEVYGPFLDFLETRGVFPIGLHISGPLIEWLEANDAALLDRIGRLVSEGRVELLAGGWYEPILAAIPPADRRTQIAWAMESLHARFGVRPVGLWLTERVWEPELIVDLSDSGVEYVLIDDHLALRGGADRRALQGPLRVERDGRSVDVLAIDQGLRYLIPFRPAPDVERELRRRHAFGDGIALFADDGEKFGGWPRTREWLYDQGWLEGFGDALDRLRTDGTVKLVTPREIHQEVASRGPLELPSGSYPEMDEWSGGDWKNFLSRYTEAGRLARRMAALSELCRGRGDPADARRAIGRGQCNDAYWHGVFGGVYMKHLRQGVRRELAEAERILRRGESLGYERVEGQAGDPARWWVHSDRFAAWLDDAGGLPITDLTYFGLDPDPTDTLTRRIEAYHLEAVSRRESGDLDPSVASGSIHDSEARATLDHLPASDPVDRSLVVDRVLGGSLTRDAYARGLFAPLWSWPATVRKGPRRVAGGLEWSCHAAEGPRVGKTVRIRADGAVEVVWTWDPDGFPSDAVFAPELSLGREMAPDLDPATEVWRYPIVTVSKCPDGFERIEQGLSLTPLWSVRLGRARLQLKRPDA